MRREKNWDWQLVKNADGTYPNGQVQISLLMDIRDHLADIDKSLRALRCPNFVAVPEILRSIQRNTTKARKSNRKK